MSIDTEQEDTSPDKNIDVQSNVQKLEDVKGADETEIAATIHVAGGDYWGWVVVAASACILAILDGVSYTFGSFLEDIKNDFQISIALVTLINSVAMAVYYTTSPSVSALINRFGFRAICMAGSIISSFALFFSCLADRYWLLIVFYGIFVGFGFSMINMASSLVVGFYFQEHRSVAMSIATAGSSVGVMLCYPLYSYLVKLAGWRSTMMLHSGLFGMIYFFAMAFRPLITLNVVKTTTAQVPQKTITFLPNLATANKEAKHLEATRSERLFNAVQNTKYPTAAAVIKEPTAVAGQPTSNDQADSSTPQNAAPKITITAASPGSVSHRQLKQVQSLVARGTRDKGQQRVDIKIEVAEKKTGFCGCLCHWDRHVTESRPMYRDDAFYTGKVEELQEYRKSRAGVESGKEEETGLEYHLAVSRAAAASDLAERRGVFTTAFRRVLATMLDPKLMRRKSYFLICVSGTFNYLGYLVPYVFIQSRNLANGIAPVHCSIFVSVIGFSNLIGRLTLGALATKIDPLKIFAVTSCVAGLSTIGSCITYNLVFQYGYCVVYGYCVSGRVCLRSIVLVALYGLDKLTNATGMCLLFQGIGCLISTPLSSVLQTNFGYLSAFAVAGSFIFLGGLVVFPIKTIAENEDKNVLTAATQTPVEQNRVNPRPQK